MLIAPDKSLLQVTVLIVVSIDNGKFGSEILILSRVVLQLMSSVTVTVYRPVSKL